MKINYKNKRVERSFCSQFNTTPEEVPFFLRSVKEGMNSRFKSDKYDQSYRV